MPDNLDGLNIIITGDPAQALEAINKVDNAVRSVKGSDVKITADASQAADEAAKLADTVQNLDGAHVDITADSSQAVDAAEKVADAEAQISGVHSEITADASQAVDEAGKASDALQNIGDANSVVTADTSQAQEDMQKIHDVIAELDGKKVTFTVIPTFRDVNGRLHDITGKFLSMGQQAGQKVGESIADGAEKGVNQAEQYIKRLLMFEVGSKLESAFGNVCKTIIAGAQKVANVLSGVVKSSLAIGGGFESQMTIVKTISGATAEELDALTKKARELGATTPLTAKNIAEGMTVIVQRGTSVQDTLASIEHVVNLSISQGISMANAAALLGSTISNFGMSIDDAAKITAVFNNACNQSALDMGKLTEAMKYIGPTAGALGMDFTEAVAGAEVLANAGLTGEMIGTGLTRVLTKLATKTEIMGVKTRNATGQLRPLADVFTELRDKGFSLAEANSYFGSRGMLGAVKLVQLADTIKVNEARLKDYGTTQAAVSEKSKTFSNNMAALRSAIEEVHIEVFDQIKDKAKSAVSGLTAFVRALAEWIANSKIAQQVWQAFLDGLGFNIPSGDDFKKFLANLNVQELVKRAKDFAKTVKDIANSIISFASLIKTPILFLIKHLDTFAKISFWGWIVGKGLQIPAILTSFATAFKALYEAVKALGIAFGSINFAKIATVLSNSSFLAFLTNPGVVAAAAIGMTFYETMRHLDEDYSALFNAREKEKQYLLDQAKADQTLDIDLKVNVKTGFEKLPQSWTKASDEIRDKANSTVKELQDAFRVKVAEAIDTVSAKFPDMAQALQDTSELMTDKSLRQLTKALQGNKDAFLALPPHMQLVAEHLYNIGIQAGQTEGSLRKIIKAQRDLLNQKVTVAPPIPETEQFFNKLSAGINSLIDIDAWNQTLERINSFTGGKNIEINVGLLLNNARNQLNELSKSIAKDFNLSPDIVSAELADRLQLIADKGNNVAQALVGGWDVATKSLDIFLANAQDTVKYLGASPDKFLPALNSLANGIQKIDPLTGKVTEQFKKAHDALQNWSNVTFDQLTKRIQKLRKAVEAGFLSPKALADEFENVSKQVKLQIATEFAPMREQFNSLDTFHSVVASEYMSRMQDIGGDVFKSLVGKEFQGSRRNSSAFDDLLKPLLQSASNATRNVQSLFDKLSIGGELSSMLNSRTSSRSISYFGSQIMNNPEFSYSQPKQVMMINGVDMYAKHSASTSNIGKDIVSGIEKGFSAAASQFAANASRLNANALLNSNRQQATANPSNQSNSEFSTFQKALTDVFNNLASKIDALISKQDNSSSNNSILNAVSALQQLTLSVDNSSSYIARASEALNSLANSIANLKQDNSTSGGIAAKDYSTDLAGIIKELQAVSSSQQAALNVMGNIATSVASLGSYGQAQQQAVFDGNSISQAIISGLTPFISRLDAHSSVYQSATSTLSHYFSNLDASVINLMKATDANSNALNSLQNSMSSTSSGSGESFTGALAPLVNSVQSLAVTVSGIQSINQDNASVVYEITNAVRAVENAVKSINGGNTYNIDIHQEGFQIEKKSDADILARSTASAFRTGLGNGGV